MDVTKISFPSGIDADDLAFSSLISQMAGDYAYFGAGSLSDAEIASLDSAFAWDTALAANFNSLGELAESAAKVESKLSTLRSRKYRLPGRRASSISLSLAGISQLQKKYLESSAFSSTPITIVLRSRDKGEIVIFNGLRWTVDWSGEVDGLFQVVISSEFTGTTTGKIYTVSGIPTTGIFMINEMLPFAAWSGETTPTQSFRLAAYQVPAPITLTAPTGFHISTSESSGYAAELTLPATFNGTIYARLISETKGAHSGNISAASTGAATMTSAVSSYLGDGTETNPYPVSTAAQLDAVRNDRAAYYSQLCDIDLSAFGESYRDGAGWIALGLDATPFTGNYDGGNFAITGLYMNDPAAYNVALFGACSGATLTNIRVIDPVIHAVRALGYYCGTLCSEAIDTTITDCHAVNISLFGHGNIGGLAAAFNENTDVTLCSVSGRIVADGDDAAGFVGSVESDPPSVTIQKCWANVRIFPSPDTPTATGFSGFSRILVCTIIDCYAIGTIVAEDYAFGFAQSIETYENTITAANCYAAVFIKCGGAHKAGFAGTIVSGSLVSCYFDSTVTSFTTEDPDGATPATSAEMFVHDTFTDWDFTDDWEIKKEASYPTLQDNPQ